MSQVRAIVDMLADCGWTAALLCRHVDISTVLHMGRRLSTPCPPVPPPSVPSPCPGAGPECPDGGRPTSAGAVDPQLRTTTGAIPRGG